ncbi:MAG: hypothetical protein ACI815_002175 [Psychroserpens sp.]|jgi:hypothetical protein
MVTIVDYGTYQKEDRTEFCSLVVQGGVEAVKSLIIHLKKMEHKKSSGLCTRYFF